jgi:hypothetical protein
MAKSKSAPVQATETPEQELARYKAENAALRAAAASGRVVLAPGVYEGNTLPAYLQMDAKYPFKARRLRVLETGEQLVWTVSMNGWMQSVYDFVPRKGQSPSPGNGGYMNRHMAYAKYHKGADYNADLSWGKANGANDAPAAK